MSEPTLTETPQQADRAVTIYEKSVPGRRAAQLPPLGEGVEETPLDELIPARLLREDPARLPEVSEPEIIRHYAGTRERMPGIPEASNDDIARRNSKVTEHILEVFG